MEIICFNQQKECYLPLSGRLWPSDKTTINKVKIMKKLIYLILSALMFASCTHNPLCEHTSPALAEFEKSYINNLAIKKDEGKISVVGIISTTYTGRDAMSFRETYSDNSGAIDQMGNVFVLDDGETVTIRMYIPLANARLECGNSRFIADQRGEFVPEKTINLKKLRLYGKAASDFEREASVDRKSPVFYSNKKGVVFFYVGDISTMH